jgi:signal transduction histidine kinase
VHGACMLDDFLLSHREAILASARARVASRPSPKPTEADLANGVPAFLDQLGDALRLAKSSDEITHEHISATAAKHGADLLRIGLTIAQVVHDYGDVCQAITELAVREHTPITGDEFRTLNLCLDDAIAQAVTEYTRQREQQIAARGTERLGFFAHELRNLINTATLAFGMIKSGTVAPGGSTSVVLGRSLTGLRDLVDRTLADVRLDAGIDHTDSISVADFVAEVEIGALIQAQARAIDLVVTPVAPGVTIAGDRQVLVAAVANLLQNAFKFTPKGGEVSLTTIVTSDRVLFEIEDECGGLPPGKSEELFRAYEQRGADRSGLGLGLAISLKAARATGGDLRVRDLPGKGCVFTLDLPRIGPRPWSVIEGGKGAAAAREPPTARGA